MEVDDSGQSRDYDIVSLLTFFKVYFTITFLHIFVTVIKPVHGIASQLRNVILIRFTCALSQRTQTTLIKKKIWKGTTFSHTYRVI